MHESRETSKKKEAKGARKSANVADICCTLLYLLAIVLIPLLLWKKIRLIIALIILLVEIFAIAYEWDLKSSVKELLENLHDDNEEVDDTDDD